MAAQVPQSFRNRSAFSGKPFHFYHVQVIFRVVLTMSAVCLLELDVPFALAQPATQPPTAGEAGSASVNKTPTDGPSDSTIPELELIREEETVSIAARQEQPISEAPANVYVITDEDIRQSGATDIPTVLRRIPGIEVMQVTGADFNVSARGDNQLRANKMLVLLDGRSIYLDDQGGVFWKVLPISLLEIKRIEVLKGPASVLYGFNAFDGVINIITKSGEQMKGATLQVAGGEFGTFTTSAIYGGKSGKLDYRLSAGQDQNQKWRDRNSLAFRQYRFNAQGEYALTGQSRLLFSGGVADANHFDGPLVDHIAVTHQPALHNYVNVGYERPNFFLRAFWNRWDLDALVTPNNINNRNVSQFVRFSDPGGNNPFDRTIWNSYNVEGQHALDLWFRNRLSYGFNYRHNAFDSNFLTPEFVREDRLGFYIQDEWRATQTLTAVAGVRYDLDTFINPTVSPRVALVYTPIPDHSFRIGLSVGYRPPTVFETNTISLGIVTLPFLPSPIIRSLDGSNNLNPEKIISYDASYQGWYLKHRLNLRAALFFNHISDLIGQFQVSPTSFSFLNQGQADIYGGEASLEALITRWLTGFASFSYQEIGQTLPATSTLQRGGPRFKYNIGLRGDWDNGINGEIGYYYVGQATYPLSPNLIAFSNLPGGIPPPSTLVGSYNLLNIRAAYRFWEQKKEKREAEVAVTAFNSLNDRHREHPVGDVIGSRVMGWLTIRF
jgi:iron complex outermembrane receptor protein